jgi:hypothetical protein
VTHRRKSRPRGPASFSWPARGSHRPAGKADLALTWRTVTLVSAPQEHHFPVGLRSKRAARVGHEPFGYHATPLTEALHVPLHLEGSAALSSRKLPSHARTRPRADRLGARGDDSSLIWAQRFGMGPRQPAATRVRELLAAAPSMPASPSAILQCVPSRILAQMQAGFWATLAASDAHILVGWRSVPGPCRPPSSSRRHWLTAFADLVNERLMP